MDVPGVALITGAASGIGRACAVAFAMEGASAVALLDRDHNNLAAVQAEIGTLMQSRPQNTCQISVHELDVTNDAAVDEAIRTVVAQFKRIDYVVNAAGIAMKHEGGAAFAASEDWNRILGVNLTGTFLVMRAAARIMLEQTPLLSAIDGRPLQRGSIVNFGSIQAAVGIPWSTAYAASKHGVLGLTRTASEDYAGLGLRINAICPGYTETPLTTGSPLIREAMEQRVASAVPMGRMGAPREIADGVLYLAGGRSSFVTGTALFVDGGYTQR